MKSARQGTLGSSPLARLLTRRETSLAILLALMLGATGLVNRDFVSPGSLIDLLVQCAPAVIVGCGLTLVVVCGEIDISMGSLIGLLGAVMGILASGERLGLPVALVIPAVLAAGAVVGLLNGLLVTVGRAPSILVTLGMLTLLRGVTELLMGGEWITGLPDGLRVLGTGSTLGLPLSVWTAGGCVVLCTWWAQRTPHGLRMYALGSNAEAARAAGLPIGRLKRVAFAGTGLLTAVAALVSLPQLSVIESGLGVGFELLVVTAVVLGGTSIRGGSGTILGTALAALLLGSIRPMLLYLKLGDTATYWERAIQGGFILVAVLLDPGVRSWLSSGRAAPRQAAGGSA